MSAPTAPALALLALSLAGAAHAEPSLYFGEPGGTVEVAGFQLPGDATRLTVELRFKALERLQQPVKLVSRWSDAPGGTDRGSFYLGFSSTGQVQLGLRNAQGATKTVTGGGTVRPGAWHHAAAAWNGDEAVLCLDGKPVMTQKLPDFGPLAPSALPLVVGPPPEKDRKPVFFDGFVADVAVWSVARDAATIAEGLARPLAGTEPGLAAFLPLREASPRATVKDRSAAGLEGRLSDGLARTGWCVTPAWNEPAPERPYVHLFAYDLSAPALSENGAPLPAPVGAGRQILVGNEKARQAGVLWQDASTKAIHVTWVETALSGHRTLPLPGLPDGTLLAGTSDPTGNLYYVAIQPAPKGRDESLVLKGSAYLVRPDGKPLRELPLDLSKSAFNYYADGGRGSMAVAGGLVGLILPRTMYVSGDGLHHQAAVAATFPADLSGVQLLGHTSSHSFGNVLVPGAGGSLLGVDLGDNYPRGVHLHRIARATKASRVVFTYKTAHGTEARNGSPVYGEISGPGRTFYKWSNDNATYTELGGVVEGQASCTVIVATDRSPEGKVLDNSRIGIRDDPRDLALLRVMKSFEKGPGGGSEVPDALLLPGNPPGAPPETGGFYDFGGGWSKQRVTGVVWLTQYKPGEAAHAPHLLRRRDGSLLVLWEKTGPDGPSLWAMAVHESGKTLAEPVRLGVDLQLHREDPVLRIGTRIFLLARDRGGRTRLCFVNDG